MIYSQTFDAILFDMDGTLVDSTPVVEKIWAAFANRHSLDPVKVLRFAHGRPTVATINHFVADPIIVAKETALISEAEAKETCGVTPILGAKTVLNSLPDNKWVVVTSATKEITRIRMGAAKLPLPKVLVTAEDIQQGKPSPEGYLLAAKKLGVNIGRCIIFEDAQAGIAAGVTAGGKVVIVGDYVGEYTKILPKITNFVALTLQNDTLHISG